MAKAVFVQDGDCVDFIAVADLAAGDVVARGDLIGVVHKQVSAGQLAALSVEGVFDVEKAAGVVTAGQKVFWDAAARVATTSDAGGVNKLLGKAIADAASNDATVRVRLSQ